MFHLGIKEIIVLASIILLMLVIERNIGFPKDFGRSIRRATTEKQLHLLNRTTVLVGLVVLILGLVIVTIFNQIVGANNSNQVLFVSAIIVLISMLSLVMLGKTN